VWTAALQIFGTIRRLLGRRCVLTSSTTSTAWSLPASLPSSRFSWPWYFLRYRMPRIPRLAMLYANHAPKSITNRTRLISPLLRHFPQVPPSATPASHADLLNISTAPLNFQHPHEPAFPGAALFAASAKGAGLDSRCAPVLPPRFQVGTKDEARRLQNAQATPFVRRATHQPPFYPLTQRYGQPLHPVELSHSIPRILTHTTTPETQK
jgi:hypothetical protein